MLMFPPLPSNLLSSSLASSESILDTESSTIDDRRLHEPSFRYDTSVRVSFSFVKVAFAYN